MNSYDLFEFLDYLDNPYLKKVESILINQCINPTEFKEFNTSLGSHGQDYLSYLVGTALVDGTFPDTTEGHLKFLKVANGLSERFFRNTIHHAYNLSIYNDKEEVFDNMMFIAIDYLKKNNGSTKEYIEIQFRDYINNMVSEKELDPKFFELGQYSMYHKKLQSQFLKNELDEELNSKENQKKLPKI